jgi:IS5 family transposase
MNCLQHWQHYSWVFTTPEVSAEVFKLLEESVLSDNHSKGRPGMDLWQILVLGVVRLTLDINYDRLHHVANYDSLVRQLLGQPAFDMELEFKLSTLKDNVPLLSEALLEQINAVIVRHGGGCIKKKDAQLALKVDSYVFESNVHFPTDLNLALDCARKCILTSARLSETYDLGGWRKHANWCSKLKGLARRCSRACRSGGKNKTMRVETTAKAYLEHLYGLEEKILGTL